jgi:hypothetical protein
MITPLTLNLDDDAGKWARIKTIAEGIRYDETTARRVIDIARGEIAMLERAIERDRAGRIDA